MALSELVFFCQLIWSGNLNASTFGSGSPAFTEPSQENINTTPAAPNKYRSAFELDILPPVAVHILPKDFNRRGPALYFEQQILLEASVAGVTGCADAK